MEEPNPDVLIEESEQNVEVLVSVVEEKPFDHDMELNENDPDANIMPQPNLVESVPKKHNFTPHAPDP